jgi:hypothetical protein
MFRTLVCCTALLLVTGGVTSQAAEADDKRLSGMSVVGDHESPKSLVIVPWKSSGLGDTLDVSRVLDAGPQPVDRDVFARGLAYYELRAESHRGRSPDTQ